MCRRTRVALISAVGLLVTAAGVAAAPASASGGAPTITRGGGQETFADDFILELCGIESDVTVTERWTLTQFPDGSETLQVERSFVSSDPRIPTERGAGISFTASDGTRRVVGKPIQLFDPDGGVRVIDAGWVEFDSEGEQIDTRGPHPSLDIDLADLYCP